jgi:hypothetical protein
LVGTHNEIKNLTAFVDIRVNPKALRQGSLKNFFARVQTIKVWRHVMLKKQYIVSLLVVLLSLGLAGSVIAGENDYNTILGSDEFSFEASETNKDTAANSHVYDQEKLALVGTEAGDWQYDYSADAIETKSEQVASDHNSDQSQISAVGTEAGDWEYRFDSPENAVCGSC